jgi:hypothetical protein
MPVVNLAAVGILRMTLRGLPNLGIKTFEATGILSHLHINLAI